MVENFCALKAGWHFRLDEIRQRFRLTPTEKRVAVFVVAAIVLGLATKCYREAHPSPAPEARSARHAKTAFEVKEKRAMPEPSEE